MFWTEQTEDDAILMSSSRCKNEDIWGDVTYTGMYCVVFEHLWDWFNKAEWFVGGRDSFSDLSANHASQQNSLDIIWQSSVSLDSLMCYLSVLRFHADNVCFAINNRMQILLVIHYNLPWRIHGSLQVLYICAGNMYGELWCYHKQ